MAAVISFSFWRKKKPSTAEPSVGLEERLKEVEKEWNDEWNGGRVLGTINFSSDQLVLIDVGDRTCRRSLSCFNACHRGGGGPR